MAKKYTYKDALKESMEITNLDKYKRHGKSFYNSQKVHNALTYLHITHAEELNGKYRDRKIRLGNYHTNCFIKQDNIKRILTKAERKAIYTKCMNEKFKR